MQLTLDVPDETALVLQMWNAAEVRLALEVGVHCVKDLKRRDSDKCHGAATGQEQLVAQLIKKLEEGRESDAERERQIANLKQEHANDMHELDAQNKVLTNQLESAKRESDAERELQIANLKQEHANDMRERDAKAYATTNDIVNRANTQANQVLATTRYLATQAETDATKQSERNKEEKAYLNKQILELQNELTEKTNELKQLSVSANKGNANEKEILEELRAANIHAIDTSKGHHNLCYHDFIASFDPLTTTQDSNVPVYKPEAVTTMRCSIEWKGHSRSGAMTSEREKFDKVRHGMVQARRADCFCFAAFTSIPGKPRRDLDVTYIDCRYHVTGYVGAADINTMEIALVVQTVLLLQTRLNNELRKQQRPANEVVDEVVKFGNEMLIDLQKHITQCDIMGHTIKQLSETLRGLREGLVASLFKQLQVLIDVGYAPRDEATDKVHDSFDSLAGGTRISTDRILQNKEQFTAAKRTMESRKRQCCDDSTDV